MQHREPFESLSLRRCQWVSEYVDAYKIFKADGQQITQPAPSAEEAFAASGVQEARKIQRRQRSQEIIIPPGELRDENGNPLSPPQKSAGVLLSGVSGQPLFDKNVKMPRADRTTFQPISAAALNVAARIQGSAASAAAPQAAPAFTPVEAGGAAQTHIDIHIQQTAGEASSSMPAPSPAAPVQIEQPVQTAAADISITAHIPAQTAAAAAPLHAATMYTAQPASIAGEAQVHIQASGSGAAAPVQPAIQHASPPTAKGEERKSGNRIEQILAETLLEERLAKQSAEPAPQPAQQLPAQQSPAQENARPPEMDVPVSDTPLSADDVKNLMKPE